MDFTLRDYLILKQGEEKLFIADNKAVVESFVKKLESLQYDSSLLRE